jgi:periplasmic divalent cation tolerance protein
VAKALLVLTTADSEELAKKIAETLVKRHQAACVNIVPAMTSVYRWAGKLERDAELLLLIKTLENRFDAVSATIRELHGYEVPEVFAIPALKVEDAYLRWMVETVTGKD